ncbi:MAG TPA: ArgR family transcriptional regulator [Terriglobia bacterium]|nr:ArgR family transcriptional regulator [Terriglobia bacterium]
MKKIRQKAILDLVRSREIASQEELLENLLARKIDVSQSTLSRDIQELGLAKTGGVYAVMDSEEAPGADDSTRRILREFLNEVSIAQNIVVLKTGPAHASTVSRAIDSAGWPEVVGSIAGDDTVFVLMRTTKESQDLRRRILEYLK